jgi:hypothetical protein
MFNILDPVRSREASEPVEKLADWELFQSLASELMSPNIQIHFSKVADKAAHDSAATIASAYMLLIIQTINLGGKYEIRGLDSLLEHKKKAEKIMARNQGFSIQNGSKLGHSKYQNGPE